MLNKGFCVNNGEIKIDNGILRVIVDYQRGGNILSLYFNNKNFELLFQIFLKKVIALKSMRQPDLMIPFPILMLKKLYIRAERLLIMIMVTFGRQE